MFYCIESQGEGRDCSQRRLALKYLQTMIQPYISLVLLLAVPGMCVSGVNSPVCETCKCQGKTVDCSNRNLSRVPESLPIQSVSVKLNKNKIRSISRVSFKNLANLKFLDLSMNQLNKTSPKSFRDLKSLQTLYLTGMKVYLENNATLFRNLKLLTTLKIDRMESRGHRRNEYPVTALKPLVALQELWIDGLNASLGSGFKDLRKLKKLVMRGIRSKDPLIQSFCMIPIITEDTFHNTPTLTYLEVSWCSVVHLHSGAFSVLPLLEHLDLSNNFLKYITNDTLEGCRSLRYLTLYHNEIYDIDPNAFSSLTTLSTLDLSGNIQLEMKNASKIFRGLRNTNISILKLNKIYVPTGLGIKLKAEHFQELKPLNLTEFHFDTNKVELVEDEVLRYIPTTVTFISARENQFKEGGYYIKTSFLTSLQKLDISYQYFPKRRKKRIISNNTSETMSTEAGASVSVGHSKIITITVPPNLSYVDFSHSKISQLVPGFSIQETNNITMINASSSLMYEWIGPIGGLKKLQYLDLSNNFCIKVNVNFFDAVPSLECLLLSHNYLGGVLGSSKYTGLIFKSLKNLTELDLSFNMIESVTSETFGQQYHLEILNLSHNGLEDFNIDISQMRQLQHLDLSKNKLTTFNQIIRASLDTIADSRSENQLNVNLTGNTLQCSCQKLPFLQWLLQTKTNVSRTDCQFPNGTRLDIDTREKLYYVIQALRSECSSKLLWILGASFAILLAIMVVVAGLLYRFRWKLRYLYYSSNTVYGQSERPRRMHLGYEALETSVRYHQKTFDAYICFDEDEYRSFVESMVEKLEKENGLKLCIPDRDLTAGKYIQKCIVSAIQLSRKTVFLMSKQFWSNGWCVFAMEMARQESIRTKRNVLLAVFMEPGQYHTDKIQDIFKAGAYIEYPYNQTREAMEHFWSNLRDGITGE